MYIFNFYKIGGLQVKAKDGSWVDVPPINGTLIVNVGDVAEIWTNGFCRSVMHRVAKPTTRDRYSVATFVDPCLECIIVPGDAKGNSNCEVDERFKNLSSAPYKFEDFLCDYYAKSLS